MKCSRVSLGVLAVALALCLSFPSFAQDQNNKVMGKVDFNGLTKVDREAGVWVDGQYVGYLRELKGDKQVLLLPGEHEISVRENGYDNFEQKIAIEPGKTTVVQVQLQRSASVIWPKDEVTLKIDAHPSRAAVFVDDTFVGHAGELGGATHSMEVSPGKHSVRIELPGYETFRTEVDLAQGQKEVVKTDLVKNPNADKPPVIVKQ